MRAVGLGRTWLEAERRPLDRQKQDISEQKGPNRAHVYWTGKDIRSGLSPLNVHGLKACGSGRWYLGLVVLDGDGAQPLCQLTDLGEAVSWEHAEGHELLDGHVEGLGDPSELGSAFGHGLVQNG